MARILTINDGTSLVGIRVGDLEIGIYPSELETFWERGVSTSALGPAPRAPFYLRWNTDCERSHEEAIGLGQLQLLIARLTELGEHPTAGRS